LEGGSLAERWSDAETAPPANTEALTKEDVMGSSMLGFLVVLVEFEVARWLEYGLVDDVGSGRCWAVLVVLLLLGVPTDERL
jgi:hypothetical protein